MAVPRVGAGQWGSAILGSSGGCRPLGRSGCEQQCLWPGQRCPARCSGNPGLLSLPHGTAAAAPCAMLPALLGWDVVCCRLCLHIAGSIAPGCNSKSFSFFFSFFIKVVFWLICLLSPPELAAD